MRALDWAEIFSATGLSQAQIRALAARLLASKATIVTWAMGLTQHKHAVATLRDIVNVLLLQGNIGHPGAGLCPVRGHSNVQGDRTMGIFEQMPSWFHDALDEEFGFTSPRAPGYDTVGAIRAMRERQREGLRLHGRQFRPGHPGHPRHRGGHQQHAADRADLYQAQQIPRHHRRRALILPTLGRTDRYTQASGDQRVTVEDSMSAVHTSRGRLDPPTGICSPRLPSSAGSPGGCSTAAPRLSGPPHHGRTGRAWKKTIP
ncbi:MAG: hypothetical protein JWN05_1441 [Arthrobacter sp.]|nr:hypothetical protein [Arthrobacter sp.]